jgi:hypothetical protein
MQQYVLKRQGVGEASSIKCDWPERPRPIGQTLVMTLFKSCSSQAKCMAIRIPAILTATRKRSAVGDAATTAAPLLLRTAQIGAAQVNRRMS